MRIRKQPLDDEDPNEVELSWADVIERRRRELDDGTTKPLTKDEFLRCLRESS